MYVRFRYSGKNPMRLAVSWHISVRFCGFGTPNALIRESSVLFLCLVTCVACLDMTLWDSS